MASNETSDYELLTEHFSYPPVALIDDIINTINVLADRALDSVERLLLNIPPQNLGFKPPKQKSTTPNDPQSAQDAAKLEIENGTHQLETLLNAAIDKNFDIFELYTMQNILTVQPKHQPFMRLSHYNNLDLSGGPDKPTLESITALRRRLQASQKLHVALESERAKNDALLRKLKSALGASTDDTVKREDTEDTPSNQLGFLRDKGTLEQGGTNKPITTTTEFTLSQLNSLRSLSQSLTRLLPELGGEADDTDAEKSWRRERAEYIESASRKYLERSGGLELGPHGEVRDGEWQGGGRSLTKSEVEGLENVAAILGKKEDSNRDDDPMDES
ncbi:centromere protein Mis12 [Pochonia chlamydosporia 170]|uniref:Centromere protein Mis12 n=1 Tax=Pochonia chlamydosporia 170 TaxID=1380566 RepID=A0A179FA44_METCM|nr:centromere protein Mis12 [Pochonia chlamydosporia 170]OAQ62316.1 centromere protein Mis12 [Pochonia chlamydosporia 170]